MLSNALILSREGDIDVMLRSVIQSYTAVCSGTTVLVQFFLCVHVCTLTHGVFGYTHIMKSRPNF